MAVEATALPAWLALVSALFTVVPKGLDCDVYQSECKRLGSAYDAPSRQYHSLRLVDKQEDLIGTLRDLDKKQADLCAEAQVLPPDWVLQRAAASDSRARNVVSVTTPAVSW